MPRKKVALAKSSLLANIRAEVQQRIKRDASATDTSNDLTTQYNTGDKMEVLAVEDNDNYESILDAIDAAFSVVIMNMHEEMERKALNRNGWEFIRRLDPDGHKLFRSVGVSPVDLGEYAIADNSGGTPDETEDGVLWVDEQRPMVITGQVVSVPVRSLARKSSTVMSFSAARKLRGSIPTMQVFCEDEDLKALLK